MRMKNIIFIVSLFLISTFVLMGVGMQEEERTLPEKTQKAKELIEEEATLVPGETVLDYTLENWNNRQLGKAENILFDVRTGYMNYVVFDIKDQIDAEQKLVPIPVRYLILDQDKGTYYVDIQDMEILRNAVSYEDAGLMQTREDLYEIDTSLHTYWQNSGINPAMAIANKRKELNIKARYGYGPGMQVFPGTIVTLDKIKNAQIVTKDKLLTGNIDTIILDPKTGQIKTTVFSHDELGPENPILVPISAYSVEAMEAEIRIDATSDEVSAAPRISPDNIKQRANETAFVHQIRNYWVRTSPAFGFRSGARILPPRQFRASTLFNYDIMNWEATSLGTVEDYIMTKDGRILYLLVRPDDLFEAQDRLYPIPVQAITLDRVMKQALVGLEEKDFEELPSIESKKAIDTTIANWDKWITDYWTTKLIGREGVPFLYRSPKAAFGLKTETPAAIFMSDFLTFRVFNNEEIYMGGVEDAIISLEEGTIDFVITTYSPTFIDLGRKQIPVPFESITIPESFDRVLLEADRQTLRTAPGMENIDITDRENREWVNIVKEYWK